MASPMSPGYSVNLDESSGFTPAAGTSEDSTSAVTSPAMDANYTPPATADVALPPPSASPPPNVPPRAPPPPRAASPLEAREETHSEPPSASGTVWEWLRAHWVFVMIIAMIIAVLIVIILILGLKNKCEPCPKCHTLSQSDIEDACQRAGTETFDTVSSNNNLLKNTKDMVQDNQATLRGVALADDTATKSQVHALADDTATKSQVHALQKSLHAETTAIHEQLLTIEEDARHCVPARTQLTKAVSRDATTLHVKSAKDFPQQGLLSVGTQELIRYTGHTETMFFNLTRGCSGSVAMVHLNGKDVVSVDPATGTCLKPPATLAPLAKSFWFIPTMGHVPGMPAGPIPLHYDKVEALTNEDPKTNVVTTVHSIVGASIFLPPEGTTDARHGVKWTLPRPILCEQSAFLPVKFGPLQGNITCMFE